MNKNSGEQTFHKAGKTYEEYAEPQRWAAEHLMRKISASKAPQSILELGCGTGLLTRSLAEKFPESTITACDISEGMLEIAKSKSNLNHVKWIHQDMCTADLPQKVALITSGCTFHWLEDLPKFLSKLWKSANTETELIFSVMLDGTVAEIREARQHVLPHHTEPAPLPKLNDILSSCEQSGWTIQAHEELPYCARFASAWELLQSLQKTGVTGGRFGSQRKPLFPAELKKLTRELTRIYGQHHGGIPLHYQVGFISCKAS